MKISKNLICVILILSAVFSFTGCAFGNKKYIFSTDGYYVYDNNSAVYVKSPSELKFSNKEFMVTNGKKAKYLKGTEYELTIPSSMTILKKDIKLSLFYVVENGKICFSSPLKLSSDYRIITIPDNADTIILWVDSYNAYLVNIENNTLAKIFDDEKMDALVKSGAETSENPLLENLVWAEIVSLSPDGDYLLFKSNRNYINDGADEFDLFCKNLETNEEIFVMPFTQKEFIAWQNDTSGNFLYRERFADNSYKKNYSDIMSYSLSEGRESAFFNVDEAHTSYELAGGEHFYVIYPRGTPDENLRLSVTARMEVVNIYNGEIYDIDLGSYISAQQLIISPDGQFAAFLGTYLLPETAMAVSEIASVRLSDGEIAVYTEVSEKEHTVDNFCFGSTNLLTVNFLNSQDQFSNLAYFYEVK